MSVRLLDCECCSAAESCHPSSPTCDDCREAGCEPQRMSHSGTRIRSWRCKSTAADDTKEAE